MSLLNAHMCSPGGLDAHANVAERHDIQQQLTSCMPLGDPCSLMHMVKTLAPHVAQHMLPPAHAIAAVTP